MAVTKKTVASSKSPKPSPKAGAKKASATKITPTKMHTTVVF